MAKLAGKNVGIYISTDGGTTKRLAICMTTGEISFTTETVDSSSKCDEGFGNSEPGKKSWTISGEGFSENGEASASQMSFREVWDLWDDQTSFKVYWQDGTSGTYRAYSGNAIITSLRETATNNEYCTYQFELTGQGAVTDNLA